MSTGMGIKDEDENIFAGIEVRWEQNRFALNQFLGTSPVVNPQFVNSWSFTAVQGKIGFIIGMFLFALDRSVDLRFDAIFALLTRHLLAAGFSKKIFEAALRQLEAKQPHLLDKFRAVVRPLVSTLAR